jgi:hypothetical protein
LNSSGWDIAYGNATRTAPLTHPISGIRRNLKWIKLF